MEKDNFLVRDEINFMLFTDNYISTLGKIGYSKEFRLKEQIRKQKECIEFLAAQIDELNDKIENLSYYNKILKKAI